MTLMALSLSIGILIDDAIVVLENICRHMEKGRPPREAASTGTHEIGVAVVATTLALCAVFLPIAFMGGVVGRFFREFGLVAACAVLNSLLVALTLTPMLCSRYLRPEKRTSVAYHVLEAAQRRFSTGDWRRCRKPRAVFASTLRFPSHSKVPGISKSTCSAPMRRWLWS